MTSADILRLAEAIAAMAIRTGDREGAREILAAAREGIRQQRDELGRVSGRLEQMIAELDRGGSSIHRPHPYHREHLAAVMPPHLEAVSLAGERLHLDGDRLLQPAVQPSRKAVQIVDPGQHGQDQPEQQKRLEQCGGHGVPIVAPRARTE